ncbi:hypothetical protein D3C71_1186010 [compost metagenome]
MSLNKAKVSVVGGQMNYSRLTSKVEPRHYAIGKAHCWLDMINRSMRPKKWNKPTTKGTKVTFDAINSEEELESAFGELEQFISQINVEHGTDITLNRAPEKGSGEANTHE